MANYTLEDLAPRPPVDRSVHAEMIRRARKNPPAQPMSPDAVMAQLLQPLNPVETPRVSAPQLQQDQMQQMLLQLLAEGRDPTGGAVPPMIPR